MSIHGRDVADSGGAYDGFEALRPFRDDAGQVMGGYVAAELDDVEEDNPALLTPVRTRRSFAVPPLSDYVHAVLDAWQERWGELDSWQRSRFFHHRAIWELTRYPEVIVLRAVRRVRRLDEALALVRAWAEGDTRLDDDPDDLVEPQLEVVEEDDEGQDEHEEGEEDGDDDEDDRDEEYDDEEEESVVDLMSMDDLYVSYEAANDILEDICADLLEAEGAEDVVFHAALGRISVDEACRELNNLLAHYSYVSDASVEPERVRQAIKYVRQTLHPDLELSMDECRDDW